MSMSTLARNPVLRAVLPVGSRRRAVVARTVRSISAPRPQVPSPVQTPIRQEEAKLRGVWAGYRPEMLDIYLVSGYQDPRINSQSILGRHTLVRALFGSEFEDLMREEFAHAVELNEVIRLRAEELGVKLTATLDPAGQADVQRVTEVIADRAPVFAQRWREALAGREAPSISVLEFACGSANDYRAFADYGIARFLDYTGIDLNKTNIANAKRNFPDVNFRVGSILSLPEADRSIDYVIGFDILEHLSLEAMQTAVDEAVRICQRGLYFAFFRMEEIPENVDDPRGNYHINRLSAPRMREQMTQKFTSAQVMHMPTLLKDDYGYTHSYNRKAFTLITEGPR
jgi:ubiquinone/menaquinone biosynthesis C-methylase UbiE